MKKTLWAVSLAALMHPWTAGAQGRDERTGLSAEIVGRFQSVAAERGYDLERWQADWQRIVARQPAARLQAARAAESYDELLAALDLQPSHAPAGGEELVFVTVAPCRIVDTRGATGSFAGPILPGIPRSFSHNTDLAAQGGNPAGCGVPSDPWAIAVTLTAVAAAGPGDFRAYPFSLPAPLSSVINYASVTGLNLANTTILPTCLGCGFDFTVQADGSAAQLVADVVGYFVPVSAAGDITGIVTAPTSGLTGGVDAGTASLAIAPSGVDTARLAGSAVTGPKIANSAVGVGHLNAVSPPTAGEALVWNGSALDWQTPPAFALPFIGAGAASGALFSVGNSDANGMGVAGAHTATTGTAPGVRGSTASTVTDARGVEGIVTSTGPGGFSAGVRGINLGTAGLGIGVYGSHAASGWGVYGTSPSGIGVLGSSAAGVGVEGIGNVGVAAVASDPATDVALSVNGALAVSGTVRPAVVHTVAAGNICSVDSTAIDHPLANGDPDALVFVTPRVTGVQMRYTVFYSSVPYGTCPANRWVIRVKAETAPDLLSGDKYNVLVIKTGP